MTNFQHYSIVILPKGRNSMGESIQLFKSSRQTIPHLNLSHSNLDKLAALILALYLWPGVKLFQLT